MTSGAGWRAALERSSPNRVGEEIDQNPTKSKFDFSVAVDSQKSSMTEEGRGYLLQQRR